MYNAEVDYYRARSVADAVKMLQKHKGAKLLAGGHSLIPSMKLRVAQPAMLVDIGHIEKLSGIKVGKKDVKIGALTTHATVARSEELKSACPILAEAAALIADPQVRNRGTIGGSLANADPASDYPTLITALDATLTVTGPKGEREIQARKFFKDLFTTALKRDEVLTSITVPAYGNMPAMGGAYLKHRHPASSYAVVGVAGMLGLEDGRIKHAVAEQQLIRSMLRLLRRPSWAWSQPPRISPLPLSRWTSRRPWAMPMPHPNTAPIWRKSWQSGR